MLTVSLLADFAIRLSFGLILALIVTSWHEVPLRFFRIQNQIILGTMVLGALDQARTSGPSLALWLIIAGAVLAYLATISWGLGLPRFGIAAGILGVIVAAAWLVDASRSDDAGMWALNTSGRSASGLLLGATLTAMLLGHYYLIAPAMTIEPLKRSLNLIAVGLVARCLFAGVGLWVAKVGLFPTVSVQGMRPTQPSSPCGGDWASWVRRCRCIWRVGRSRSDRHNRRRESSTSRRSSCSSASSPRSWVLARVPPVERARS